MRAWRGHRWLLAAMPIVAAAAGLAAVGEARPDPSPCPPAAQVRPPKLRETPDAQAIWRAYPLRAVANRLAGVAQINCAVRVSGTLYDCRVVKEAPAGEGFALHALDLIDQVRVDPLTCDGRPVEGARVVVPIRFQPPSRTFRPH